MVVVEEAAAVVAATMVVAVVVAAVEAVVTAVMATAVEDEGAVGATIDVDLPPHTAAEAMAEEEEVVDEVPATLVHVLALTPLVSMVRESPAIRMVMLTEC